ncbi:hypothetical protein IW152_003520, partial [Coemansia sp. BCRC 34962]
NTYDEDEFVAGLKLEFPEKLEGILHLSTQEFRDVISTLGPSGSGQFYFSCYGQGKNSDGPWEVTLKDYDAELLKLPGPANLNDIDQLNAYLDAINQLNARL